MAILYWKIMRELWGKHKVHDVMFQTLPGSEINKITRLVYNSEFAYCFIVYIIIVSKVKLCIKQNINIKLTSNKVVIYNKKLNILKGYFAQIKNTVVVSFG